MGAKPTLSEIAAMPLSEGAAAIRKYYDPNWGTDKPSDAPVEWSVEVRFYHHGYDSASFTVKAATAEEAEQKATEIFRKGSFDLHGDKCEVETVEVEAST